MTETVQVSVSEIGVTFLGLCYRSRWNQDAEFEG